MTLQIQAAMLCDAATVREGLLHVLGGGVSALGRPDFPAPLGASLAVMFMGTPSQETESHIIRMIVRRRGVDEKPLVEVTGHVQPVPDQIGADPVSLSTVFPIESVLLPEPGRYEARVEIDGEVAASVYFFAHVESFDGPEVTIEPLDAATEQ